MFIPLYRYALFHIFFHIFPLIFPQKIGSMDFSPKGLVCFFVWIYNLKWNQEVASWKIVL